MIHTTESLHKTGRVERVGECLIWKGAVAGKGYGVVKDERERYAHRLVLFLDDRPLAENEQAAHICGESRCIEPSHLYGATQAENERDKIAHGRANRGIPGVTHCGKYLDDGMRCKRAPHDDPCKPDIFETGYEAIE